MNIKVLDALKQMFPSYVEYRMFEQDEDDQGTRQKSIKPNQKIENTVGKGQSDDTITVAPVPRPGKRPVSEMTYKDIKTEFDDDTKKYYDQFSDYIIQPIFLGEDEESRTTQYFNEERHEMDVETTIRFDEQLSNHAAVWACEIARNIFERDQQKSRMKNSDLSEDEFFKVKERKIPELWNKPDNLYGEIIFSVDPKEKSKFQFYLQQFLRKEKEVIKKYCESKDVYLSEVGFLELLEHQKKSENNQLDNYTQIIWSNTSLYGAAGAYIKQGEKEVTKIIYVINFYVAGNIAKGVGPEENYLNSKRKSNNATKGKSNKTLQAKKDNEGNLFNPLNVRFNPIMKAAEQSIDDSDKQEGDETGRAQQSQRNNNNNNNNNNSGNNNNNNAGAKPQQNSPNPGDQNTPGGKNAPSSSGKQSNQGGKKAIPQSGKKTKWKID